MTILEKLLALFFIVATTVPICTCSGPQSHFIPDVDDIPEFSGLDGFYSREQGQAILDRTIRVEVHANTEALTENERRTIEELMAIGEIFHRLYEDSRHPDAHRVRSYLMDFEPQNTQESEHLAVLRDLYRMFRGPIVMTLDNERVPLAPVTAYSPQRNMYPPDTEADALRNYAQTHPDAGLLEVRTLVRRRTSENLATDRQTLELYPALATLHPDFVARLEAPANADGFYGVPYSIAYAAEMHEAYERLRRASDLIRDEDEDLADYFERRAHDFLTNDYESGDAAWVSGRPRRLNAQIGAYETYDDHLLSLKAFFSLSILLRDPTSSAEIEQMTQHLPRFESELPGGPYGRVRNEIPVGVYDVYADYGQSRGTNTASILPNESHIVSRYGRIILIRRNIMRNPALLDIAGRRFRAAVSETHANDLTESGGFDRTVYHEIGHYLGPKRTEDDRLMADALGELNNHFEELKADLISLWLMPRLLELGILDETRVRSAYASGILRILVAVEPRRDQPYRTMQLMQQNFYLEHELLRFEQQDGRAVLHIDYSRYPEVIESMLEQVLDNQKRGNRAEAEAFIERWARWNPEIQGAIGSAVDSAAPRFRLVSYTAF